MAKSMTSLRRTMRAFTAALAIVGVTAVMAGVKTARAFDPQASEATVDDETNRQAAGQHYAVAPPPGSSASARRDRRIETPPATNFQDNK